EEGRREAHSYSIRGRNSLLPNFPSISYPESHAILSLQRAPPSVQTRLHWRWQHSRRSAVQSIIAFGPRFSARPIGGCTRIFGFCLSVGFPRRKPRGWTRRPDGRKSTRQNCSAATGQSYAIGRRETGERKQTK